MTRVANNMPGNDRAVGALEDKAGALEDAKSAEDKAVDVLATALLATMTLDDKASDSGRYQERQDRADDTMATVADDQGVSAVDAVANILRAANAG
jgi:hypothetical protein